MILDLFARAIDILSISTGQSCMSRCQRRLTGLRVDPAGVEEVGGEVDVDVAEEKQHVAAPPGPGPNVEPPPPRKRLVQLKQRVVLKINFPADKERIIRKQKGAYSHWRGDAGRDGGLPTRFEEDYKYIFNLSLFSF